MSRRMCVFVLALAAVPAPSPKQYARILHLENSLMAPCCYTQTVAIHGSDVAIEIRHEIVQMVLAGQTDSEILNHYKELYGPQILVEPEGGFRTVLYCLPVTVAVVGVLLILAFLRYAIDNGKSRICLPPLATKDQEEYKARVQADLLQSEEEMPEQPQHS